MNFVVRGQRYAVRSPFIVGSLSPATRAFWRAFFWTWGIVLWVAAFLLGLGASTDPAQMLNMGISVPWRVLAGVGDVGLVSVTIGLIAAYDADADTRRYR